jgi:hypothetical protein
MSFSSGPYATLSSTDMLAFASRRVCALYIRLDILMLTIGRGKFRNSITTNCLPSFPSIRGIYLNVLVLHLPCISATCHI